MTHSLRTSLHTSAHELSLVFLLNNDIVYYLTRTSLSTGVHNDIKAEGREGACDDQKKILSCSSSLTILIMPVCVGCPTSHSPARLERRMEERRHSPLERLCSIIIAFQLWEGSLTVSLVTWLSWKRLPVFDTGTSWESQLGQEGIGDAHHVKLISSEPHNQEHLHPQAKSICHGTSLINQVYGNLAFIKNSIHTM